MASRASLPHGVPGLMIGHAGLGYFYLRAACSARSGSRCSLVIRQPVTERYVLDPPTLAPFVPQRVTGAFSYSSHCWLRGWVGMHNFL